MIIIRNTEEKELVQAFRNFVGEEDYTKKFQEVLNLQKQVEELKISKSRIVEDNAKQERELRHMIGLEKKRQEFEIEEAKRRTALEVREENLKADQKRFEEHLKFNTDRFEAAAN